MVEGDFKNQYKFLMWGGGIFLVVIGLGILLLVSFIIGEPMILAYPYLNETVLLILKIVGGVYIIPGIILFILGFWAGHLAKHGTDGAGDETKAQKQIVRYIRIFAKVTSILLMIAFPLGTFIGITLLRESWMLKNDCLSEAEEKKGKNKKDFM